MSYIQLTNSLGWNWRAESGTAGQTVLTDTDRARILFTLGVMLYGPNRDTLTRSAWWFARSFDHLINEARRKGFKDGRRLCDHARRGVPTPLAMRRASDLVRLVGPEAFDLEVARSSYVGSVVEKYR